MGHVYFYCYYTKLLLRQNVKKKKIIKEKVKEVQTVQCNALNFCLLSNEDEDDGIHEDDGGSAIRRRGRFSKKGNIHYSWSEWSEAWSFGQTVGWFILTLGIVNEDSVKIRFMESFSDMLPYFSHILDIVL